MTVTAQNLFKPSHLNFSRTEKQHTDTTTHFISKFTVQFSTTNQDQNKSQIHQS